MENISIIKLYQLPKAIKLLLILTVLNLTVGVGIGLYYVSNTTHLSPEGTAEQFRGSSVDNNFDIPEKFSRPCTTGDSPLRQPDYDDNPPHDAHSAGW